MKKDKKITQPKVTHNPLLDKYEQQSLFPEKVKKGNDMLKNIGIPKFEFVVNDKK